MPGFVVTQQAVLLALSDGQSAHDIGQGCFHPRQTGSAFIDPILEGREEAGPVIVQQAFGQGQAEGDAGEMVLVRQGFAEPGDEHQVLALSSQALGSQGEGQIPVG
ncbi:hypothetical protein D3C71_1780370 [compost metagenome]